MATIILHSFSRKTRDERLIHCCWLSTRELMRSMPVGGGSQFRSRNRAHSWSRSRSSSGNFSPIAEHPVVTVRQGPLCIGLTLLLLIPFSEYYHRMYNIHDAFVSRTHRHYYSFSCDSDSFRDGRGQEDQSPRGRHSVGSTIGSDNNREYNSGGRGGGFTGTMDRSIEKEW